MGALQRRACGSFVSMNVADVAAVRFLGSASLTRHRPHWGRPCHWWLPLALRDLALVLPARCGPAACLSGSPVTAQGLARRSWGARPSTMLPGCGATCQNGFSVGAELWGREPCSSSCSMLLEAWHKREAKTSVALSELYLALPAMSSVFSSSAGRVFTNVDWPA